MESVACEAVVIGAMEYREADKIISLFTLEHGKVRGLARGAKKSVRRFGGALELFARLRLRLILREGLATLQEAEAITIYPRIRSELPAIALAGYACELVDLLMPEALPNRRLFRLLTSYLEQLDQAAADPADRRFFEMNLLNILGYCPQLKECRRCGAILAGEGGQLLRGVPEGLLCTRCGPGGRPVSAAATDLLVKCLQVGRFGAVRFSPIELAEAGALLDEAIAPHLHRPLRSLAFLAQVGLQNI